jgi:hypothetical protein
MRFRTERLPFARSSTPASNLPNENQMSAR